MAVPQLVRAEPVVLPPEIFYPSAGERSPLRRRPAAPGTAGRQEATDPPRPSLMGKRPRLGGLVAAAGRIAPAQLAAGRPAQHPDDAGRPRGPLWPIPTGR